MSDPHILDQLEPGALQQSAVFKEEVLEGGFDRRVAVSAAISLKRIADALTGNGVDFTDAAWRAGQAFENGRKCG